MHVYKFTSDNIYFLAVFITLNILFWVFGTFTYHSYSKMTNKLWNPNDWCTDATALTLKHREMHGCVFSTVATDALVLKHQAISIHNAD